ncbi:MAG: hypothetical protein ACYCPT_08350 [Acidimicrobiales bacterium]
MENIIKSRNDLFDKLGHSIEIYFEPINNYLKKEDPNKYKLIHTAISLIKKGSVDKINNEMDIDWYLRYFDYMLDIKTTVRTVIQIAKDPNLFMVLVQDQSSTKEDMFKGYVNDIVETYDKFIELELTTDITLFEHAYHLLGSKAKQEIIKILQSKKYKFNRLIVYIIKKLDNNDEFINNFVEQEKDKILGSNERYNLPFLRQYFVPITKSMYAGLLFKKLKWMYNDELTFKENCENVASKNKLTIKFRVQNLGSSIEYNTKALFYGKIKSEGSIMCLNEKLMHQYDIVQTINNLKFKTALFKSNFEVGTWNQIVFLESIDGKTIRQIVPISQEKDPYSISARAYRYNELHKMLTLIKYFDMRHKDFSLRKSVAPPSNIDILIYDALLQKWKAKGKIASEDEFYDSLFENVEDVIYDKFKFVLGNDKRVIAEKYFTYLYKIYRNIESLKKNIKNAYIPPSTNEFEIYRGPALTEKLQNRFKMIIKKALDQSIRNNDWSAFDILFKDYMYSDIITYL